MNRSVRRWRVIYIVALGSALGPTVRGDEGAKPDRHVGLGGHCPVSYQTESKAIKGDPDHAAAYQGSVYHCASSDAKQTFEANPAKYAAQYGELCTTALGGSYGNRLPSDPTVFYVIEGKLYLFSSLRARNAFDRAPADYIAKADKLFEAPSFSGYSLTSYQLDNKAEKGDAKFKRIHRGQVYHFASDEAAKAFDKEPERFVPKYEGYCAEGVSTGKQFPGDPKVFAVVDGKTYLFFDAKAKGLFEADRKAMIEKADSAWIKMLSAPRKKPGTRPGP